MGENKDLKISYKNYDMVIEEEAHVSSKDLLRFAQTDLMLYGKRHTKIHTVVMTKT